MNDAALRALLPTRIVRGALLRPDGVAVGLVSGGAPAWDLCAASDRARLGMAYHRLLLAQDAPVAVYSVDAPLDLDEALDALQRRRATNPDARQVSVLDEVASLLLDAVQGGMVRARMTVWAVTGSASLATQARRTAGALDVRSLLGAGRRPGRAAATPGAAALAQALERARRLAEGLNTLGGTPPARLMEAEEIARLLYRLLDPVRATRYPLAGTLLDRVRRVVTAEEATL